MGRRRLPEYGGSVGTFAGDLRSLVFPKKVQAARYFRLHHATIGRYEDDVILPPSGYLACLIRLAVEQLEQEGEPGPPCRAHFLTQVNEAIADIYQPLLLYKDWESLSRAADTYLASVRTPSQARVEPGATPRPPRLDVQVLGREALKAILIRSITHPAGGTPLAALWGPPGVGKTTLALWLANETEIANSFRDGVLWVSLGQSPDSAVSLGEWLTSLGLDSGRLKELKSIADRVDSLRALLANRACLLVVDDIWDISQARHFLSARGEHCAALITGRDEGILSSLAGPDQVHLLGTLEDEAALMLLRNYAGTKVTDELQSKVDPETQLDAALTLVRYLGNLPLALRLAGTQLRQRARAGLDPAQLLAALRREESRLLAWRGEISSGTRSQERSLDTVIRISYEALPDDGHRRAFRRLAVFGAKPLDFDQAAALAIWRTERWQAEEWLTVLVNAGLVEVAARSVTGSTRYALHQVIYAFALAQLCTAEDEQREACLAHASHYLELEALADQLYVQGHEGVINGLLLHDREWPQVKRGQAWARQHLGADDEATRLCMAYPIAGANCLSLRIHPHEWIEWLETGLTASQCLHDRRQEGSILANLGRAHFSLGDTHHALGLHEQALAAHREVGNRWEEGHTLGEMGHVQLILGEAYQAIAYYEQALAIHRAVGDRRAEGARLGNLGMAYLDLGNSHQAIACYTEALVIHQAVGDRRAEGNCLGSLGIAYRVRGDSRQAIAYYQQALAIHGEIGERRSVAADLGNLGNAYLDLAESKQALGYYEQALAIHRSIGDKLGEGNDLGNLGNAYLELGDGRRAIEQHERALAMHQDTGDRWEQGRDLDNMGRAYLHLQDAERAIRCHEQASAIHQEVHNRWEEGRSLTYRGNAFLHLGDAQRAIHDYERALAIQQEVGDRLGEANCLSSWGQACAAQGDTSQARSLGQEALAIYQALGSPRLGLLQDWLAQLR